jgi:hypothetical protein
MGRGTMIREIIVWIDKKFGMHQTKKLMIRPRKYKQDR